MLEVSFISTYDPRRTEFIWFEYLSCLFRAVGVVGKGIEEDGENSEGGPELWMDEAFPSPRLKFFYSRNISSHHAPLSQRMENHIKEILNKGQTFKFLFLSRCRGRKLFSPKELSLTVYWTESRRQPINKTWQEKPQHQIFFRKHAKGKAFWYTRQWRGHDNKTRGSPKGGWNDLHEWRAFESSYKAFVSFDIQSMTAEMVPNKLSWVCDYELLKALPKFTKALKTFEFKSPFNGCRDY